MTQCHGRVGRVVAGGQFPATQHAVHIGVEVEVAVLDQCEHRHRRHGLADRSGLEQRVLGDRSARGAAHAVTRGPVHLAVAHRRHRDPRHAVALHALLDGEPFGFATRNLQRSQQTALDPMTTVGTHGVTSPARTRARTVSMTISWGGRCASFTVPVMVVPEAGFTCIHAPQ